jgi:protein-tyrosine-phosphatase/DNA-binding transcriptional ArsR family regulator
MTLPFLWSKMMLDNKTALVNLIQGAVRWIEYFAILVGMELQYRPSGSGITEFTRLYQYKLMYNSDMHKNHAPEMIKLLSNDVRWQILTLLAQSDLRVQELSGLLGQPQNLVSYHLQKLRDHSLIVEHHSIADGREVYYGIHLRQIQEQFRETEGALHPGITHMGNEDFPIPPLRVLFLCTHNSARSQIAEGFLKAKSRDQIQVFSAGTDPIALNPIAIQVMAEHQIDIHEQQAKDLEQFRDQSFDYIITVCDRARETCPIFPGNPIKIHWSIPDPTVISAPNGDVTRPFRDTASELSERIDYFLAGFSRPGQRIAL